MSKVKRAWRRWREGTTRRRDGRAGVLTMTEDEAAKALYPHTGNVAVLREGSRRDYFPPSYRAR